jgi:chemotaxis protein methyltransferase CheR
MKLSLADAEFLQKFLYEKSGLDLDHEKSYLWESRLGPLLKGFGVSSLQALVEALRKDPVSNIAREVVEAMTTNESLFFRDGRPFEYFEKRLIPELVKGRPPDRTIRLWSAACSTGQEPYSLGMLVEENRHILGGIPVEILATDLNSKCLKRAEAGVFSDFEVRRGVPEALLSRYFESNETEWKISPKVRSLVRFEKYNLLDPFTHLGPFDVIFCRNVLIYFDLELKRKVLTGLKGALANGGTLILGGAESVLGIVQGLDPVGEDLVAGAYRASAAGKALKVGA